MDERNHNRNLALMVFDAMNKNDFTEVEPFLSDEVILNFPGVGDVCGTKRVVVFMKTLLRKYPELTFYVSDVIAENDGAVAVWTNKGETAGGDLYENSGMTLFYFADGRITYISDYFKDTSFLQK